MDEDQVELVIRARRGDMEAFETLIAQVAHPLFRYVSRFVTDRGLAEDVVQEALVRAHRQFHLLRDPGCFRGWLWRIARCAAADELRRGGAHRDLVVPATNVGEELDDNRSAQATADLGMQRESLLGLVRESLQLLPSLSRRMVELRYGEGRSYMEIAEDLGVSAVRVKARLARARRKLKGPLAAVARDWSQLRDEMS